MKPKPAALGFRAHAGWAAVVCLGGPDDDWPVVVERKRLLLTTEPLPFQPYHRAKGHAGPEAEASIRAAADEARDHAVEGIASLIAETRANGYKIGASAIVLGSGRPDFSLRQALSNHAAMHNAEGWLNREALIGASRDQRLRVFAVPEETLYFNAAMALARPEEEIHQRITKLGASIGPPWTIDQKLASLAAWIASQTSRCSLCPRHRVD